MQYLLIVLVPALIALIVCSILKGSMKTANKQSNADIYISEEGVAITHRSDVETGTEEQVLSHAAQGGQGPGRPTGGRV